MSHDDGNRQTLRKLRPHHGIEVGQVGRVEGLVLLCEVPDRGSESGGRMHLQTMPCSRRLGAIIHGIGEQMTPVLTFFIGVWAGATIINLVWLRAASKGKL